MIADPIHDVRGEMGGHDLHLRWGERARFGDDEFAHSHILQTACRGADVARILGLMEDDGEIVQMCGNHYPYNLR